MKNKLRINSILISLVFSLLIFAIYWYGGFINFESKSLDWRFKQRGPTEPQSPVIVAAVDEESLDRIGKWPWRRKIHAKFVDVMSKAGAKVIVFDVLFYEADRDRPWDDAAFVKAIKRSKRTISAFSFEFDILPIARTGEDGETELIDEEIVMKGEPLPEIMDASRAVGFVNAWPDEDGSLRRADLTFDFEGEKYASLNLHAVSVAKGIPVEEIIKDLPMIDGIPGGWGYDSKEVLVNFRGPQIPQLETFPTYSYAELIDENIPLEWIKEWVGGKIVLVGATALGTFDHYNTPFQTQLPGVYFHANIVDNLWNGDFLTSANIGLTICLILLIGISGGIIVPRVTAWQVALSVFSFIGIFWYIGYILLAKKLYYMELVAPTVSMAGSYISVFFYRFIVEQKEKAGIKKAFGVYVNPHVVEQIAKNPDALKLGGEMRDMTVMFSDVAGFTSISEKLTPQELVQLLNLYLTSMTDTIMKYDGTVDKYEGDAIMAFWGAPLIQPNHSKQACIAVLENRERLKELNVELEKKGMHKLAARCGLNSGPMNVGNMGSSQKFNYTVMGDAVNLASRLEGANKQYGTYLMISEMTYDQVKEDVEVRELDLLRVKGKKVPIKVFELLDMKGNLTDAQKKGRDIYNDALGLYRKRDFKKAMARFQKVQEILPEDGPSETYIGRSKDYIKSPPPEKWDRVFVMTTK